MANERVYRMKLPEFSRYLEDKRSELRDCYQHLSNAQAALKERFAEEMATWQERYSICYPLLAAQQAQMPEAFAKQIDLVEREERVRIRKEIEELDHTVGEGRTRMDALLADSQQATATLRIANPGLNKSEERLKELMVKYQDEYAQAYEEIERLSVGLGARIKNAGRIRGLRKAQRIAKKEQAATLEKLRKVRQKWLVRVEAAGDTQSNLRAEWQEKSVEVSQAQSRREYLDEHFDTLAEQATLQRILEELEVGPEGVSGELGPALASLADQNHVRWDYERGLESAGEALGYTKSVGEGLKKFHTSVKGVVAEQRRYNLKQVKVELPHSIALLNETWKMLSPQIADQRAMADSPIEFSKLVRDYIKQRLTNENIQLLFESMGKALNRATSAWS